MAELKVWPFQAWDSKTSWILACPLTPVISTRTHWALLLHHKREVCGSAQCRAAHPSLSEPRSANHLPMCLHLQLTPYSWAMHCCCWTLLWFGGCLLQSIIAITDNYQYTTSFYPPSQGCKPLQKLTSCLLPRLQVSDHVIQSRRGIELIHACVPSCFSHVPFFATLWTVAHQAPLSMGFSRQEY